MNPFIDLSVPASNGLRRGYTTGICAAAAAKAALQYLVFNEKKESIDVELPSLEKLLIKINFYTKTSEGALVQVTKDAGDDPDITHNCKVEAEVRKNNGEVMKFFAGPGVGTVTEDGLQIPKGEPAINPSPREIIRKNLKQILEDPLCPQAWNHAGIDVIIGILDGEKLALKTFNPRVGVVGGLSILGTTGIVEPMSLSAWKASIEIYINVALASQSDFIVFSPGRWGQQFFHKQKGIPKKRICMVSNFIGFSLDHLKQKLALEPGRLNTLILAGHPGKLAKLIDGHWNTHSNESPSALPAILNIARSLFPKEILTSFENLNTVEHLIHISAKQHVSEKLFEAVANQIAQVVSRYVDEKINIEVYLSDFKGNMIGKGCSENK